MNKWLYIIFAFLFTGCDSKNALDCFQKEGTIIFEEVNVGIFTRIIVWEGIQLIVEQGDNQKVLIETGENLLNEIEVNVEGNLLSLKNTNDCNYVRDYGITKLYVTTPNITEIRNSSSLEIRSNGVLNFPSLSLISEDYGNESLYDTDGNFNLILDVEQVNVVSNGFSNFQLSGEAERANFSLYGSNTRIDAGALIVQDLTLYHRSANKMIVNPQVSIKGSIVSVGDVISKNRPPIVEVEELFQGRLIFE